MFKIETWYITFNSQLLGQVQLQVIYIWYNDNFDKWFLKDCSSRF